jgi:hypothetical protein
LWGYVFENSGLFRPLASRHGTRSGRQVLPANHRSGTGAACIVSTQVKAGRYVSQ